MEVTREMLDAALRKAVETGLLPRHALRHGGLYPERDLVRLVIEAALQHLPEQGLHNAPRAKSEFGTAPSLGPIQPLKGNAPTSTAERSRPMM